MQARLCFVALPHCSVLSRPNRPLAQLRLRRFSGLFWPSFDSFCGGSIRSLIQPPQNESKTRLKRTQKSTETKLRKRSNVVKAAFLIREKFDFAIQRRKLFVLS